jgi:hypothetical protein
MLAGAGAGTCWEGHLFATLRATRTALWGIFENSLHGGGRRTLREASALGWMVVVRASLENGAVRLDIRLESGFRPLAVPVLQFDFLFPRT